MGKNTYLPPDIKQICLWYVRGYDRRVKQYHEQVEAITYGSGGNYTDCTVTEYKTVTKDGKKQTVEESYSAREYSLSSGSPGDPTASKADKLAALNKSENARIIRAVEQAKINIGADIQDERLRQRLIRAVWLNCISRYDYPYELLGLDGVSRMGFYRRKDRFLCEIAKIVGLI